jgi:mRNA export factor
MSFAVSTTGRARMIAPTDCAVSEPGDDGVSSLLFSPTANILVSGNWDSGIRAWEIQVQDQNRQVNAVPKAKDMYESRGESKDFQRVNSRFAVTSTFSSQ